MQNWPFVCASHIYLPQHYNVMGGTKANTWNVQYFTYKILRWNQNPDFNLFLFANKKISQKVNIIYFVYINVFNNA